LLSTASMNELSVEELRRYHRQMILPELGLEGQLRLKRGSVLIVGAGGLGGPVALYLAAAGVGRLGLIDDDAVDLSNLQRQILFTTQEVGLPKSELAEARLSALNPEIDIEIFRERLTSANALERCSNYDVIVDCTDNFPTRYLINDAAFFCSKPVVYGAILRFEGQLSVFQRDHGPCYRCLFAEPPPPDVAPSCAEAGVLGAIPGVIGALQAAETLKLLLGLGAPGRGRLTIYDALQTQFRNISIKRRADCALCGDQPTVAGLIDYEQFCAGKSAEANGAAEAEPGDIDAAELRRRLQAGEALQLVDVRESWERSRSAIQPSTSIPLGELSERLGELDPAGELIVYCQSGGRSARARSLLRERGYERVQNLRGGVEAWLQVVQWEKVAPLAEP
jgi:sulfur-carrier protein adenylyltransferase/sulfurtransferase